MFCPLETTIDGAAVMPLTENGNHTPWMVLSWELPVLFMLARIKGEEEYKLIFATDGWGGGCFPPRTQNVRWVRALLPPSITGSPAWRMERVDEIWDVEDGDTGVSGRLLRTEAAYFSDVQQPVCLERLKLGRRVYPLRG